MFQCCSLGPICTNQRTDLELGPGIFFYSERSNAHPLLALRKFRLSGWLVLWALPSLASVVLTLRSHSMPHNPFLAFACCVGKQLTSGLEYISLFTEGSARGIATVCFCCRVSFCGRVPHPGCRSSRSWEVRCCVEGPTALKFRN